MKSKTAWRSRVKAALNAYFLRRSYPRTVLALIILLTGIIGFLLSFGMLRAGLDHMWLRYPIAVMLSYGVLLGLIRVWVEFERSRFDPDDADIEQAAREEDDERPARRERATESWLDYLDLPGSGLDFDEGCVPVILIGVVIALIVTVCVTIAGAPLLIAEVFLDAFIVTVLYRRLRIAEKEHWLGDGHSQDLGACSRHRVVAPARRLGA
jgi:hypothetical protein